ncbi:MAG: LysR family transcriptional regulator [Oceanospirillaceae bacterium]
MLKNEKFTELAALKTFIAIAEAETITQAAERLQITQSAVSQSLKQLEQQLAVPLVVRRSRPTQLTLSGQVLLRYAKSLLGEHQQMVAAVQLASSGGLDQLRLGMIDSFADVAGQLTMQRLASSARKLSLRTGMMAPLKDALLNRDIDILITSDQMQQHPELEVFPVLRDPFVLIVANELLAQTDGTVKGVTTQLPCISYNREMRLGSLTQLIARRIGVEQVLRYELDSTSTLLRFVQSGQGWAFVPIMSLLQNPVLLEGMSILPIEPGSHARYIFVLARREELGELPQQVTQICREIFDQQLVPQLTEREPWLKQEAYSVEDFPPY